jgi:predicted nucleic acid-binding protein
LDTNVVIGLLKGDAACIDLLDGAGTSLKALATSQITRMELLGFGNTADEEQTLRRFLSAIQVITLDDAIEGRTIALRRQRKIKLPDAIIAATAIERGLTLLSLDKALLRVVTQSTSY